MTPVICLICQRESGHVSRRLKLPICRRRACRSQAGAVVFGALFLHGILHPEELIQNLNIATALVADLAREPLPVPVPVPVPEEATE